MIIRFDSLESRFDPVRVQLFQSLLSVMDLNIYTQASIEHLTTTTPLLAHSMIPTTMMQPSSTPPKQQMTVTQVTFSVTSISSPIQLDSLTTELEEIMKSTSTQRAVSSERCQLPFADKTKMIEIESVRVN